MLTIINKEVHNGSRDVVPPEKMNLSIPRKQLESVREELQSPIRAMWKEEYIKDGIDEKYAKEKSDTILVYLHHKDSEKSIHYGINGENDKVFILCGNEDVKAGDTDRYTFNNQLITCLHCKNKYKK